MARRLPELPTVADAFRSGGLGEDSVRLAVQHTPPERDAEVAQLAEVMTVTQLARTLRSLPRIDPEPGDVRAPDTDDGGEVQFGPDDDDRWSLRATSLPPLRGALVKKALEAARDAEFRMRHPEAAEGVRPTGVTWSDALERMALAALEGLDPATSAGATRAPAERFQVMVHVNGDNPAAANLHLGPALPASARRRITCHTSLRWVLEKMGRPIVAGRRRRTVDPILRKLIEDRDQGCRVPWCQQTVGVEIHHIRHVEDGGETIPENLMGLCSRDHDLHHRGLLGISGDPTRPDGLVFTDRWGRRSDRSPPVPPGQPPPDAARAAGLNPQPFVAPSGERFDGRWFAWN